MKKTLSAAIAAATLSMGLAAPAMAGDSGVSANVGFLSDYYFRGNHLGTSSPYAGLDYEVAGFYVGTWAVDDGTGGTGNNGLEVDYYFGYGMEHGPFSWGIGFTGYEYTYSEDSEAEINLSLGLYGVSLTYNYGVDNNASSAVSNDSDHKYRFVTLGWSNDTYGVTYGNYKVVKIDKAFDVTPGIYAPGDIYDAMGKKLPNPLGVLKDDGYQYLELSAGGELGGFDLGVTLGREFGVKSSGVKPTSAGGEYIFVDISKSFSF